MNFHAHVYFELDQLNSADRLRTRLIEEFGDRLRIYPLVPRKVGPHPMPMFEVNFDGEVHARLLARLEEWRGEHVVLIHEDTGQDLQDHTAGASWLGGPLELDLSRF